MSQAVTVCNDILDETLPQLQKEAIEVYLDDPRLTIMLAPNVLEGHSDSIEGEQTNVYDKLAKETSKIIVEALGINSETGVTTEVMFSTYSDIPVSLVFNCEVKIGHEIPENIREDIVDRLEHLLQTNEVTGGFEGEIWFRQGKPQIDVIAD